MAIPQNSFSREFQRNLREARDEGKLRYEANRPKLNPIDSHEVERRRAARKDKVKAAFDALQVGDSLQFWGMAGNVSKKNAKSIVTTMGNKYTLKELGGE